MILEPPATLIRKMTALQAEAYTSPWSNRTSTVPPIADLGDGIAVGLSINK